MPAKTPLGRLRQKSCKFKASLGYTVKNTLNKKRNLRAIDMELKNIRKNLYVVLPQENQDQVFARPI